MPDIPTPETPLWAPLPVVTNLGELIPSVAKYGATGDGQTDDTEALQKAIDDNKHGPLFFPAGRYRLTRALFLDHRNGGWFAGAGPNKSVLINVAKGGALRTDGCGYSTFTDLDFVAAADSPDPAFDLSWDQKNPAPPDFLGSALQANMFYRCRFEGGSAGLRIGESGFMGSETLVVGSAFSGSQVGLSVRNYNALTDNAVGCTFRQCGTSMDQAAGSFNALDCLFEGARERDIMLRNSAADCFYYANCSFAGPQPLLASGHTGATINAYFDNCKYTGPAQPVVGYAAGGSVVWQNGDLGDGTLAGGGGISQSAFLLLNAEAKAKDPFAVGGRGVTYRY